MIPTPLVPCLTESMHLVAIRGGQSGCIHSPDTGTIPALRTWSNAPVHRDAAADPADVQRTPISTLPGIQLPDCLRDIAQDQTTEKSVSAGTNPVIVRSGQQNMRKLVMLNKSAIAGNQLVVYSGQNIVITKRNYMNGKLLGEETMHPARWH